MSKEYTGKFKDHVYYKNCISDFKSGCLLIVTFDLTLEYQLIGRKHIADTSYVFI